MLYVPIRIVHIKRYLLDKFQIEIRKKKKKKKKKKKTEWKRTACLYHSNVIIISTIMLKVLRLSSKIKSGFTVPLLSEA